LAAKCALLLFWWPILVAKLKTAKPKYIVPLDFAAELILPTAISTDSQRGWLDLNLRVAGSGQYQSQGPAVDNSGDQ